MNQPLENGWSRVIVEKPFGTDLSTAQNLNRVVNDTFHEADTYRIDHYLGKETAQNIMVLALQIQYLNLCGEADLLIMCK